MMGKKEIERFKKLKEKYQERIDFAARTIAEEVKKGNIKSIYRVNKWTAGPLEPFYLTRLKKGRIGMIEVFDLAWKEVIEKASKISGVKLKFLPTGARLKMYREKELPEICRRTIRTTQDVKHAGEKVLEVEALERVLEKIPEMKKAEEKKRYKIISVATGLKPSTIETYMKKQGKKIRGVKKRR